MANRRSDNTFRGALNLQVNKTVRGSLGQSDRVDFYKFRASGQINFNLALSGLRANASVRLLNARRTPIAVSNQSGRRAEQISATLEGGTYYVQVQFLERRGTTRYNLRTSATPAPAAIEDGTLARATDLGSLTTTAVRQNSVGATDSADFYRFTLPDIANLQVRVTGSNAGTRFALIRDINANGLVDNNEILASDSSSGANSLADATQDLPQGAYFIRIESTSTQSTPYQLELIPTFFGGNVAPDPGNTLPTARDLGVFSGNLSVKEYVGPVDPADIYRFTLNDLSKLEITRTGPSREPKVQLVRDNNNNGLIDSGEIFNDDQFSILSNRATVDLPVGTYFIVVEPDVNSSLPTSYQMDLAVTPYGGNGLPDPGDSLPTARDLGNLSGTTSFKEYVGPLLDPKDIYRFTLNDLSKLEITRTGPSRDPKVQLVRDNNNNGLIDSGEIFNNNQFAITTDSTTVDLPVGTYFIVVEPGGAITPLPTVYQMDLVVTPYGGNGLSDPGNTLFTARDLGVLSGTSSLKEYVGVLDPSDFYKFTVNTPLNFRATSLSSTDLDLLLIRDTNNNGLIETSERLRSGTGSLSNTALQAGTYFVSVEPRFSGNFSTNYELSLITT